MGADREAGGEDALRHRTEKAVGGRGEKAGIESVLLDGPEQEIARVRRGQVGGAVAAAAAEPGQSRPEEAIESADGQGYEIQVEHHHPARVQEAALEGGVGRFRLRPRKTSRLLLPGVAAVLQRGDRTEMLPALSEQVHGAPVLPRPPRLLPPPSSAVLSVALPQLLRQLREHCGKGKQEERIRQPEELDEALRRVRREEDGQEESLEGESAEVVPRRQRIHVPESLLPTRQGKVKFLARSGKG